MLHTTRYEWRWPNRPAYTTHGHARRVDGNVYNGNGQLTGLVDRDHVAGDPPPNTAVPVARYVVLFRLPDLKPIRHGWSDTNGQIVFRHLAINVLYMAYAPGFIGPTGARFDAVCSDNLQPEVMP